VVEAAAARLSLHSSFGGYNLYRMPGEVIAGERPGLFGLNMFQVFGVILGFFIGSAISNDNIIVLAVCVITGLVMASRRRGLYVGEYVYHLAMWMASYVAQVVAGKQDNDVLVLDPGRLYTCDLRDQQQGSTYIVRKPDGATMVVRA
jgi:hypothetical protein